MLRFPVRFALPLALLISYSVAGCAASSEVVEDAAAVTGVWNVVVEGVGEGDLSGVLTVTQVAQELTGEAVFPDLGPPAPLEDLAYDSGTLSFTTTLNVNAQPTLVVASAEIDGDALEGTFEVPDAGSFTMQGVRAEAP